MGGRRAPAGALNVRRLTFIRASALAAVIVSALVGCMGGDERESTIAPAELEAAVARLSDLPNGFSVFDEGPLQAVDRPRGERGWKARFRRPGSPSTAGPLVVESRVDAFDDESAAAEALTKLEGELQERGAAEVERPEIGDDAAAFREREESVTPVVLFHVAWRHANVLASVTISGFAGKVRLPDAVEIARAQQARIVAAADS